MKKNKKTDVQTLRPWLPVILAGAFMLIAGIFVWISTSNAQNIISAQQREIVSLQNQIDAEQASIKADHDRIVKTTTGIDLARKDTDSSKIYKLVETAFNWDSFDSYKAAREQLMKDYQLSNDSGFMKVFMPELSSAKDSKGNEVNLIDDGGYNISLVSMTPYVMSIDQSGNYTYFCIVTIESKDKGKGKAQGSLILMATVSPDGNLSSVEAWTAES